MDEILKDQYKFGNHRTASVSVIIPCYRCAETIRRAVDSVIAQTLPAHEIILIDDCSNDGKTLRELENLKKVHQTLTIKILSLNENSGPGSARNAGWDIATQPYLAFLDADDSWHPEKLEIQYRWMLEHPDVVLTGHPSTSILPGAALPLPSLRVKGKYIKCCSLLITNCFPTRSVMLKREIQYRFFPGKRYAEDYMLWLTIVFGGLPAFLLNIPMAYSYKEEFGGGGLTGNLWKVELGELDTYRRLNSAGAISTFVLVLISCFSFLKFLRRWIIVRLRSFFSIFF